MSTVVEITSALPQLTTDQLVQIEQALHQQYRERSDRLVYDDSYGSLTEADLIASADEAFLDYDREEQKNESGQTR